VSPSTPWKTWRGSSSIPARKSLHVHDINATRNPALFYVSRCKRQGQLQNFPHVQNDILKEYIAAARTSIPCPRCASSGLFAWAATSSKWNISISATQSRTAPRVRKSLHAGHGIAMSRLRSSRTQVDELPRSFLSSSMPNDLLEESQIPARRSGRHHGERFAAKDPRSLMLLSTRKPRFFSHAQPENNIVRCDSGLAAFSCCQSCTRIRWTKRSHFPRRRRAHRPRTQQSSQRNGVATMSTPCRLLRIESLTNEIESLAALICRRSTRWRNVARHRSWLCPG